MGIVSVKSIRVPAGRGALRALDVFGVGNAGGVGYCSIGVDREFVQSRSGVFALSMLGRV